MALSAALCCHFQCWFRFLASEKLRGEKIENNKNTTLYFLLLKKKENFEEKKNNNRSFSAFTPFLTES